MTINNRIEYLNNLKTGDFIKCRKVCIENGKLFLEKGYEYKILSINQYTTTFFTHLIEVLIDDEGCSVGRIFNSDYFSTPYDLDSNNEENIKIKTGIENKTGLENKPHLCCFDPHLEYEMGMGMRAGANKHGWNNHRNLTSDSAQQILDSLKRHLNAFLRGEEKDAETNTSHLACVGNNLNFLYRMTKQDGYGKVLENIYGEKK